MTADVSVIIPYYNQGRYLERSIISAIASYSGPIQIIVVDDGSTERGADAYLRRAQQLSPSVEIVRKANGGLSSARNAGLARATGRFVQFLDCDDMLLASKLDDQVAALESDKADVSITNYVLCDEQQMEVSFESHDVIGAVQLDIGSFLNKWERGFVVPIHCGLFSKGVLDGLRFDEDVYGKEDWIFWCSLLGKGARLSYLPTFGAIYRQHPSSMTKAKLDKMGESWLMAAKKISAQVPGVGPKFMEEARSWYNAFYARQAITAVEPAPIPQRSASDVALPLEEKEEQILSAVRSLDGSTDIHISILIPLYEHYEHFLSCIESILKQDLRDVEIIVVDDHSVDSRLISFIERLGAIGKVVKVIRQPRNEGISPAQNTAAEAAQGAFLAFVDCDDMLEIDAIEQIKACLRERPGVDYVFTDRIDIDAENKPIRTARYGGYQWIVPGGALKDDLLDGMVASHLKVIKRSRYLESGGSNGSVDGAQDWDLALKLLSSGSDFFYLPIPLYRHRIHQRSVTSSDSARQFRLTNVIRRNYAAKMLRQGAHDFGSVNISKIQSVLGGIRERGDTVVVTTERDPPLLGRDIRHRCAAADLSIYVEEKSASVNDISMLKEWNSYFDLILLNNVRTYVSLIGYLWDQRVCLFRDDFSDEVLSSIQIKK